LKFKELHLIHFKNLLEVSINLDADVNCFSGNNGEGKTNILDAIRYLSMCKSYFNSIDYQNVNHFQDSFMIKGLVEKNQENDTLVCTVRKSAKKIFKRNNKDYQRLSEHIGLYPSVMISPTDEDLIKEGSETRRKFLNGIISQYDKAYLTLAVQYTKVLNQRNRLLKHFQQERKFDATALEIYDFRLIDYGEKIYAARKKFIEEFVPVFQEIHSAICGNFEEVGINYTSHGVGDLTDLFKSSLEKDKISTRTHIGIHKDDLEFTIASHPLKKFGSQGQQKTFLISIKLAQSIFIEEATGLKPFLLLDDIFDKLDENRVANLMRLVSEKKFGQIFVTDTDKERVPLLFKELDVKMNTFRVLNSNVEIYE